MKAIFDKVGVRSRLKGRTVDVKARNEVCALLDRDVAKGGQPGLRRRDLLIEYLHRIQDCYHQLSAAHLTALAAEAMGRRVREFFPKEMLDPDEIKGLDSLMAEAVTLKFVPAPLSKEQIADLIQIQK